MLCSGTVRRCVGYLDTTDIDTHSKCITQCTQRTHTLPLLLVLRDVFEQARFNGGIDCPTCLLTMIDEVPALQNIPNLTTSECLRHASVLNTLILALFLELFSSMETTLCCNSLVFS